MAGLETDGATTYSLKSFDDGGVRISPAVHTYAVDGASAGVTTDFAPTVIAQTTPVAPLHRFLRNASALAIAAGSSRQSVDATVDWLSRVSGASVHAVWDVGHESAVARAQRRRLRVVAKVSSFLAITRIWNSLAGRR
jgi:hypothetical protein